MNLTPIQKLRIRSLGYLGVTKLNVLNTNADPTLGKFELGLQSRRADSGSGLAILAEVLITVYDGN